MHRERDLLRLLLLVSVVVLALGYAPAQAANPIPSTAAPQTETLPPARPTADQPKAKSSKHSAEAADGDQGDDAPVKLAKLHNPVLWHDPGQIASLDLYYGQGGKDGQPAAPFVFESEDLHGTNPKFNVHDANGRKWRVKLGDEARPEVVASRLLWAVGYFVEDDYVLPSAHVDDLHIKRGASLARGGDITDARFARKPEGQKKIGIWNWKQDPFSGTRELNGLRVMMAVMNNWDLKDVNNAVFHDKESNQDIFLASDIGATFGANGFSWTKDHSKGNVTSFKKSRFITRSTDAVVDFATPARPTSLLIETGGLKRKEYEMRAELEWIGQNIPRADARWVGSLLSQLTHQQLVDAFRAGRFPPDQIDVFVPIVETRIQELAAL